MKKLPSKAFATRISEGVYSLRPRAGKLWHTREEREDGLQETVCRALASSHQFHQGTNLGAWLNTIMTHVKIDQKSKGYRKGSGKPPRVEYRGMMPDYVSSGTANLCDPELILMAKEQYRDLTSGLRPKNESSVVHLC